MSFLLLWFLSTALIVVLIKLDIKRFKERFKQLACGDLYPCEPERLRKELEDSLSLIVMLAILALLFPVLNVIIFSTWMYKDEITKFIFEKIKK